MEAKDYCYDEDVGVRDRDLDLSFPHWTLLIIFPGVKHTFAPSSFWFTSKLGDLL